MKHYIDKLRASKDKATRQRNNWKKRALELQIELNAYKTVFGGIKRCVEVLESISPEHSDSETP